MPRTLVEFELWSRNEWPSYEVKGESHHEHDIRALFQGTPGPAGQELTLRAVLWPEPTNPHDPSAVKVLVGGHHVGYLAKEDAPNYQPIVTALLNGGYVPVTPCRVWAADYDEFVGTDRRGQPVTQRRLRARISLVLDDWWMLVPANLPPAQPHALLPKGSAIQAQKEDEHYDALRRFVRPQGETWAYATLCAIRDDTSRTPKTIVEVRIDGDVVGQLTPAMSAEFAPIIQELERVGRATAARVIVRGNQVKLDVALHAAKSGQLDPAWIAAHTGGAAAPSPAGGAALAAAPISPVSTEVPPPTVPAPVPPKPTRIVFNLPPGWPQPPAGWEPPPGWTPPPSWPAPPPGWAFWVVAP